MPLYSIGDKRVELRGAHHYIAHEAALGGAITLEADAKIWFKVVIRAENDVVHIGEATNVQDGSVLHVDPGFPLTLGKRVTIGHKVMLHGCTVGDGSLVGINKVVRELKAEERARLLEIAAGYVERSKLYRTEFREQPLP